MDQLIHVIESIRTKMPGLRKQALNEASTRKILIDPVLEALGWDLCDTSLVQLEYTTVDGKSADYAMKNNGKPVLLVEAKALDDPLNDVKAITQVVGYAANAGVEWCVLTNGDQWKVYCPLEKCDAKNKMLFEVRLGSEGDRSLTTEEVARLLWPLSLGEVAQGALRILHHRVFMEGMVRKALNTLMSDPPPVLIRLVRKAGGDLAAPVRSVRQAIITVWTGKEPPPITGPSAPVAGESNLLDGKPKEMIEIYQAIEPMCLSISVEAKKKIGKGYFAYSCGKSRNVFWGAVNRGWVKIEFLRMRHDQVEHPPSFAYAGPSNGRMILQIKNLEQVRECEPLIRRAFGL